MALCVYDAGVPLSDLDISMMRLALAEAQKAFDLGEVPVGAVVYTPDGKVVAQAHNLRESTQDPTTHAEILAIKQAAGVVGSWRLENLTLAVTLEPCPMCAGALVNARLPRLVYGAADPKMGCVHSLHQLCTDGRMNHRMEVIAGVMEPECGQILKDFFKLRRSDQKPAKPRPGG
jgi:tRNA(adenine34) deaminase